MKIFILISFLFVSFWVSAKEISFLVEGGAGSYFNEKGKLTGYAIGLVEEMIKRHRTINTIELVPWARGYKKALNTPGTALFLMVRNPEREKLFKWVGPMTSPKFVLIARKNSHFKFKSIEDAKKVKKIGCYAGDAREKLLISKGFKNLDSLSSERPNQNNLRKLESGRIDLWVTSLDDLDSTAKELGFDPKNFETVLTLEVAYTYIAFHKSTEESVLKSWQIILDQMKKDGTYRQIMTNFSIDKYLWAL